MGSGKSTIGRRLAKELNTYFLDTDVLIESFESKTINEIFENEGEVSFRNMEKRCFDWIKNNVQNTVISVGGGLPVYIPEIKEAGKVIYLKVEFNDILKRMTDDEIKKRPLFQNIDKAEKLFLERDKIYSKLADIVIYNDNIEKTVRKIKDYYASQQ
jgi:shikimate kinase